MPEYRAGFDAEVTFSNGGSLTARDFLIDVPSADVTESEIGELFVSLLGLLMTGSVELHNLRVFESPHRGTRGGPSATSGGEESRRLVELSHVIHAGLITYPGLPAPEITPHLTRQASRSHYAEGTEFAIDRITMVGNTGTYVDAPYHRFAGGADLAGVSLDRLADLPAVVVRLTGRERRAVTATELASLAPALVAGAAVLLHTGSDVGFGTSAYAENPAFLSKDGADWLADHAAALVGIDAINIDDADDPTRPAHTALLAAGIPVVEHLTGLDQLPPFGARFTAAPPRVAEFGTFPVRAFASVPNGV